MDSDSDNVLSRDKVSNYLQQQVDTSQNADEEAEKILEDQTKLVEEIFTYEDRDEDGFISHDEFSGPKCDSIDGVNHVKRETDVDQKHTEKKTGRFDLEQ